MSPQTAGIVIGGLLPAVLFGLSSGFVKPATHAGIGTALYLVCAGVGAVMAGIAMFVFLPDKAISLRSGVYAGLVGACWAFGSGLVVVGLTRCAMPIAKLAPLYNTNTLVTVAIGLVIFLEWKDVNVAKLMAGALLVVAGSSLVATA